MPATDDCPPKKYANGGWKNVAIAILSSAILTSGVAWFGFGANTVRKDELRELRVVVAQLNQSVAKLETTVAVLSERVGRGP